MKIPSSIDEKIKTNVRVRSLLEFGFPKEMIAADLKISIDRVTEAESMFGGPTSFPSPAIDSMEYFVRFNALLGSPSTPIEDPKLLRAIDTSRARIFVAIISRFLSLSSKVTNLLIRELVTTTQNARINPGNHLMIGIMIGECGCDSNHSDNQH